MLVPALFVADQARRRLAASANRYDVLLFSPPSEVTEVHRQWMADRGILFRDDLDMSALTEAKRFSGRLTVATLMKLSLARHLADRYDRLLYLDSDVTLHDDVGRIFSLDTGEHPLAAVPSGRSLALLSERKKRETLAHFAALGMTPPYRYFNSGVLYIDVAKWNRAELDRRALEFIRANPELCRLPDEDALNAILDGGIAELSTVWNMAPSGTPGQPDTRSPVILHHMGEDKPWRRYGRRKRLFPDRSAYRLYEEFVKDTPWPDWLDRQWSARDVWLSVGWELKRFGRRLRGRLDEPSAAQRRAHRKEVDAFHAETSFADVEQGLVERIDGRLRLKRGRTAARSGAAQRPYDPP